MKKRLLAMTVAIVLLTALFIPAAMADYYMYVCTGDGKTLNAREYPNTDAKVVGNLKYGEQVYVNADLGNGWTRLNAAGAYDYVYVQSRYLVFDKPGPKPTPQPGGGGSSGSSSALTQIQKDMEAEFKAARLVTPYTVETRNARATGVVNMRWAPSKKAPLIEAYKNGASLTVIAELKDWKQVMDEETGAVGFIRQDFLVRK